MNPDQNYREFLNFFLLEVPDQFIREFLVEFKRNNFSNDFLVKKNSMVINCEMIPQQK